jgi:hypothetical protein
MSMQTAVVPNGRSTTARRSAITILACAIALAVAGVVVVAGPRAANAAQVGPAHAAPVGAAPAAPVGKLQPQGCTTTGTQDSCDVYATTGTDSVLGTSIPIWGFSASPAPGSATLPGPLLVVTQGDQVSLTLHNLLDDNVSLALPGQAPAAFAGSAGDDLTGVPNNGTRTYTFTASRPGTFIYEAGHTTNGARQVAMGLAGALVVLPADGTAYGASAGAPDTSYDDEAVLVLSEIDPALNNNPAGFDMRNYAPRYRLINGKAFPSTDVVSTDQGHKVLLRYVNAGSQSHTMALLGATQSEVGQGGHALKYAAQVTGEQILAGQTLDTIVTMPSGPWSKLALFEQGGRLDNNSQSTADPTQLAFGGMMTFLDTNAPAPTDDGVGPVSSHVRANPNPSDGLSPVTVSADVSDATTGSSPVTQAEFVVDDAVTTGVGFGVPMTGSFGTVDVTGVQGTIPATPTQPADPSLDPCDPSRGNAAIALSCLSAGKHQIFVRALDSAGNWGVVGSTILNLPKTGPQTTSGSLADSPANGSTSVDVSATGDDSDAGGAITAAEYWIDDQATHHDLTLNRSATVVSEDATISASDIAALIEGSHTVHVRSKDDLGLWGPPLDLPLVVDKTAPTIDGAAVGPNPTNGLIGDKSNPTSLKLSAQLTDRDAGGALQSRIVGAEAFVNKTTGAPGTGLQLVAVDGKYDSTHEDVYGLVPLSQVRSLPDGQAKIWVRGHDAAGNWTDLYPVPLTVDKTAPVLGPLTAAPNPTNGAANVSVSGTVTDASLIQGAEYWIGTTDPGVGKATAVPSLGQNGSTVSVTVPVGTLNPGTIQVNVRVKDAAGNWSKAGTVSVSVTRANPIFSSTFESGVLTDWSSVTGAPSATTAAKLPTSNEPASTRGLQVSGASTNYVTDTTPSAEQTYHARFAFNRNTLTAGTNGMTIFEGRSTTAQLFAVQFRMNGTQAQLRTVRAGLNGNWVNLATGTHTVQIDWSAGGSLVLRIDGAALSTQTGVLGTARLETVRLGAVTAGSGGIDYFDTFVSTRNTI